MLDEPTNHLGPHQSVQVIEATRPARDQGLGVMQISHTLPQVLEVTDRTIVLRLDRVVADDRTQSFTSESLVRAITGRSC